jgi:hypothetical protein
MADPTTAPPKRRLPFVARITGGIVLVAAVVGIGLWAERATDDDLTLPDEVEGLAVDESAEGREFDALNSDRLSEAYDGADAVAARYGDARTGILVTVVRAESGPPVPAAIGDNHDWVEDGEVTCLVTQAPKGAGYTLCQRDDGDLTVRVFVQGRPSRDVLVDVTNDIWEDVS